jgi:hypothetical protein
MPDSSDEVFLIGKQELEALPARPFREGLFGKTLEDALQTLIEKHPAIIPGRQIDPDSESPPKFVLLRREMPVGGWSLDHLLVDQEGVLTLVEAKLIQNPEARREVIGQILEYAANAVNLWGNGRAREYAVEYWTARKENVDEVIERTLGGEINAGDLWKLVEINVRQGRIRLIIAADELRPEVRRIIEYLNAEMQNAEIYGLELRCYGSTDDRLVLVPRLVGQTQAMVEKKTRSELKRWAPEEIRDAYARLPDNQLAGRLLETLDWALRHESFKGARAKNPAFSACSSVGDRIFTVTLDGTLYWFADENHYAGGRQERDQLFRDLVKLGLIDQALSLEGVSGRNMTRRLGDLNEADFRTLLNVFSQHCGGVGLRP